MDTRTIDESELVGMTIPEFFVDDIAVKKILGGECLRIYAGTWHGKLFVPHYSAIVPKSRTISICSKTVAGSISLAHPQLRLM